MNSSNTGSARGTRSAFRSYLVVALVCAVVFASAAGVLNVVVDPHAAFGEPYLSGLHPYRRLLSRTENAALLGRGVYDAFVLGPFRAEVGVDPESAIWQGKSVWNAGLSGRNFREISYVWDYVVEAQHPATVIVFLDMLLFGALRTVSQDFQQPLFDPSLRINQVKYVMRHGLSA